MAAAARTPRAARHIRATSVLLGVVAGVGFGLVALGAWHLREEGATIRGSQPPEGLLMPRALDDVADSVSPPMATRSALVAQAPQVVLLTCAECASGEVVGSLLQRADLTAMPNDSRVNVVLLDTSAKKARAWRKQYGIAAESDHLIVHAAGNRESSTLRSAFRLSESGTAFLFDSSQEWRATYQLGQLVFDDVTHDARVVS